jgi:DNA-binding protein HU-beta
MSKKLTEGEAIVSRALRTGANQCGSFWTDERHRRVVELFVDKKLSTAKIGVLMGITKNTVVGRLARCGLIGYRGPTTMNRLNVWYKAWRRETGRSIKCDEIGLKHAENKMNRKELVAAVYAGTDGLRGRAAANTAVDVMIKTIAAALAAGEIVEINSFGKFVHVNGRRHVGRNFKTGETIDVSPRRRGTPDLPRDPERAGTERHFVDCG